MDLAERLQRGGGNIGFDCIFAGHQVTQMVEFVKRLQSGEGDIDFDCSFTSDQVTVGFTCWNHMLESNESQVRGCN